MKGDGEECLVSEIQANQLWFFDDLLIPAAD